MSEKKSKNRNFRFFDFLSLKNLLYEIFNEHFKILIFSEISKKISKNSNFKMFGEIVLHDETIFFIRVFNYCLEMTSTAWKQRLEAPGTLPLR